MKMKTAIYVRVSSRDRTPENQKIQLVEFAEGQEWKYEIFEETETTRKTRPIKQELLKQLRQRHFKRLLIWKLDRWARTSTELILELEELHKRGIEIVSYMDTIDFSTATGRLQFHLLTAFAEFERDLISERTKAGLQRAKKKGKILGRHPKDCDCYNCYQARKNKKKTPKNNSKKNTGGD